MKWTNEPPKRSDYYLWRQSPKHFHYRICGVYGYGKGIRNLWAAIYELRGDFFEVQPIKEIRKKYPECQWCLIPEPEE